jgi:hypothetical protein
MLAIDDLQVWQREFGLSLEVFQILNVRFFVADLLKWCR